MASKRPSTGPTTSTWWLLIPAVLLLLAAALILGKFKPWELLVPDPPPRPPSEVVLLLEHNNCNMTYLVPLEEFTQAMALQKEADVVHYLTDFEYTVEEVCEEFMLSKSTVYKIMRKHSIEAAQACGS